MCGQGRVKGGLNFDSTPKFLSSIFESIPLSLFTLAIFTLYKSISVCTAVRVKGKFWRALNSTFTFLLISTFYPLLAHFGPDSNMQERRREVGIMDSYLFLFWKVAKLFSSQTFIFTSLVLHDLERVGLKTQEIFTFLEIFPHIQWSPWTFHICIKM